MKRSTKFALATVAALGVAAVAVPVVAQQGQVQHDGRDLGVHRVILHQHRHTALGVEAQVFGAAGGAIGA